MNFISIAIGVVALVVIVLTAIIPVIGAIFAWLALFGAFLGLVLGLLSDRTNGRNINLVVILVALFRLFIGGWIL